MTNRRMYVLVLALLAASFGPAHAEEQRERWLQLIQTQAGPECPVVLDHVGVVTAGNNGYRSEQWFVRTCVGVVEYKVSFYPATSFPHRSSPIEAVRVGPVAGARPNNSSKPTPLRGAA